MHYAADPNAMFQILTAQSLGIMIMLLTTEVAEVKTGLQLSQMQRYHHIAAAVNMYWKRWNDAG